MTLADSPACRTRRPLAEADFRDDEPTGEVRLRPIGFQIHLRVGELRAIHGILRAGPAHPEIGMPPPS